MLQINTFLPSFISVFRIAQNYGILPFQYITILFRRWIYDINPSIINTILIGIANYEIGTGTHYVYYNIDIFGQEIKQVASS